MSIQTLPFRANLQSAMFPLLMEHTSQTTIQSEGDHVYVPEINPDASGILVDRGIPQAMYMHNVMPTSRGYQSIGYDTRHNPYSNNANFEEADLVVTTQGTRTYIAADYTQTARPLVLNSSGTWVIPASAPTIGPNNRMSVATVNGVSYITFARIGTYKLNGTTLQRVTLKSLSASGVLGLVSAQGYLIAWTTTNVSWSATNDPEDFEPSDITGAGGGAVQEATGPIVYCQGTSYGFIIYTTNNAVSVTWSGNTNYPFNFKKIAAAGGLANRGLVAVESSGAQYAYTANGLQQIFHTGGKTTTPAITDFLAGRVFETYDEALGEFRITELPVGQTMKKKVTLVCDRYLILSYGVHQNQPMSHALIVDVVQGRLGKVKILHNQTFELRNVDPERIETPRDSIAFLQPDGSVKTINFSTRNRNTNGVLLMGRYQFQRNAGTYINRIVVDNVQHRDLFNISLLNTYNGKNFQGEDVGELDGVKSDGMSLTFNVNADALSHAVMIKGTFDLYGLTIWVSPSGENI